MGGPVMFGRQFAGIVAYEQFRACHSFDFFETYINHFKYMMETQNNEV